jgi:hypothetical protein
MIWVGGQVLAFYCIFHPKDKKSAFYTNCQNDGFHRGKRNGSATLYNNLSELFPFSIMENTLEQPVDILQA